MMNDYEFLTVNLRHFKITNSRVKSETLNPVADFISFSIQLYFSSDKRYFKFE